MKLLLDTHLLLWTLMHPEVLSSSARSLVEDPDHAVHFSVVSVWEIAIKHGRNRPDFQVDPFVLREDALKTGFIELPVLGAHAIAVSGLTPIHKDPFDRMLVAQATVEGITLLTADRTLAAYPGPIQLV